MIWGMDLSFLTLDSLSMFIHFIFFNFNLLTSVESLFYLWKEMVFYQWKH